MTKEVRQVLGNYPEPYLTYVRERNGRVGQRLADILGVEYNPAGITENHHGDTYWVFSKPVTTGEANELRLQSGQYFGAVVGHSALADKGVLQPLVNANAFHPDYYPHGLAEEIDGSVIDGHLVFSRKDAQHSYYSLRTRGPVRLKYPPSSDHDNQWILNTEDDLTLALSNFSGDQLEQSGLVLQLDLSHLHPVTRNIGQLRIGDHYFSFIGRQQSIVHAGRLKYGGTELTMFRGGLEELQQTHRRKINVHPHLTEAIESAIKLRRAYPGYGVQATRFCVDTVDQFVVDPSLRPGGATPASVLAIAELLGNPGADHVSAASRLHYDPVPGRDYPGEVFLNHPDLTITARVTGINNGF